MSNRANRFSDGDSPTLENIESRFEALRQSVQPRQMNFGTNSVETQHPSPSTFPIQTTKTKTPTNLNSLRGGLRGSSRGGSRGSSRGGSRGSSRGGSRGSSRRAKRTRKSSRRHLRHRS